MYVLTTIFSKVWEDVRKCPFLPWFPVPQLQGERREGERERGREGGREGGRRKEGREGGWREGEREGEKERGY